MKCPNCNTENRYDAVTCESCGTSLIQSPTEDSIDLHKFAPAHSDPLVSSESPESDDIKEESGNNFAETVKNTLSKIWGYIVTGSKKLWELLKKGFAKLREWFVAAAAWVSDKISGDKSGQTPDRDVNANDDDDAGVTFRKTVLAIALAVFGVVLIILSTFCGACSSCSCDACTPDTLTGTWVRYDDQFNGYNATDFIIELRADNTVVQNGQPAGNYELTDGNFTLVMNQMTYTATTDAGAEYIDVYLENLPSAGLRLVKLSSETGLTGDEIAELYPED